MLLLNLFANHVIKDNHIYFNIKQNIIITPFHYTIFVYIWYLVYYLLINKYPYNLYIYNFNNLVYISLVILMIIYFLKHHRLHVLYYIYDNNYRIKVPIQYWRSLQIVFNKYITNKLQFNSSLMHNICKISYTENINITNDLINMHIYLSKYTPIENALYIYLFIDIILYLILLFILYICELKPIQYTILLFIIYIYYLIKKYINEYIHKLYLENVLYKGIYKLLQYIDK